MSGIKKNKGSSGRNLFLGFITLGLLIAIIFLIAGNLRINDKRSTINAELEALEKRMAELVEEKDVIQGKIFQSNDSDYLEKVAREELNLKKEGESVVAFPMIEESSQVEKIDQEQQNLWQKIMEKIR